MALIWTDSDREAVVLIVDSAQVLIDLLSHRLRSETVRIVGTTSGEDAQALFELHRPDMVILDASVAGAFDFLQHIRSAGSPCAVIALTDSEKNHRKLEAIGIEIILSRKAHLDALLTAMQTYVNGALGFDSDEKVRILVVADEEDLARILQRFFTGRGYLVDTAKDGQQALELLGRRPGINVVLLDIRLPGMGGIAVLKQIVANKLHPAVIIMSGVSDVEIAKLALTFGAFEYVQKPIGDWQQLEGLIIACLSHSEYRKHSLLNRIKRLFLQKKAAHEGDAS
jgi:DNA-binding NtrC family response regulator